jgi:hypothetical protein
VRTAADDPFGESSLANLATGHARATAYWSNKFVRVIHPPLRSFSLRGLAKTTNVGFSREVHRASCALFFIYSRPASSLQSIRREASPHTRLLSQLRKFETSHFPGDSGQFNGSTFYRRLAPCKCGQAWSAAPSVNTIVFSTSIRIIASKHPRNL